MNVGTKENLVYIEYIAEHVSKGKKATELLAGSMSLDIETSCILRNKSYLKCQQKKNHSQRIVRELRGITFVSEIFSLQSRKLKS